MLDNQEFGDERPIIGGDSTLCIVDLLRPLRAWMFVALFVLDHLSTCSHWTHRYEYVGSE